MQNTNYLETEFLDILFQGRNKAYGAYYLRKTYPERLKQSLLYVGTLLLLVFSLTYLIPQTNSNHLDLPTSNPINPFIPDLPDDAGIYLKGHLPPLDNSDVADYEVIEKEQPHVEPEREVILDEMGPLTHTDPNAKDLSGPIGLDGKSGSETKTGAGGTGTHSPISPEPFIETEEVTLTFAAIMPEFPGGDAALYNYLNSKTRYPKLAIRSVIEGKVVVQFIVNEKGEITDAQVIKSLGHGCDEEALRVIRSMPNWKPGEQNGKKVRVYYKQAIEFTLN